MPDPTLAPLGTPSEPPPVASPGTPIEPPGRPIPPLGTPEEFHRMLVELVEEFAPRRFAICEEHGDRIDGEVVAWGMAFDECALLRCDDQSATGHFTSAESALRLFARTGRRLRLIWIDAAPRATSP
ncbi:hypothetical protein O7628_03540 [Micromonospora sp. WMMD956]|uniref:hypothetical protein n=1 Tax=Micromonospora TaxID=1873 RepID=UPI002417B523|nr:hypothetical protein [Micromonospora sp. WMMD956]MDG4814584.1 hypothetical protein [Micromonospora sp. WMMD956]